MSLSNNLFNTLNTVRPQKPDGQLLYEMYLLTNDNMLAQLRWCLDNNVHDALYQKLLAGLSERFGAYEINILVRRYKQCQLNKNVGCIHESDSNS